MNDEKFISLVEANKELYDKANPYYKFHGRKKSIWEQIGEELHTSGELCMRRWIALRDRYGREVRKSAAPSGSGAEYYKPWYLLECMQFLKPHLIPRPTRCSQNVCPEVAVPTPEIVDFVPSPSPPIYVPLPSPSPSATACLDSPSTPIMVSVPSTSPPSLMQASSPSSSSPAPPQ
ncbi:uncharacterized protein LOC118753286 [Rhagoletis pomonella]|uniref:uncharacterized protein LOC118753286 n=1 Tax=Rhagoletis pomonella TaxID=28610 RepID=UPI001783223A|nr:uncharacterized protein LOC118753286 [Rhagoletis pomonella]